MPMRKSFSRSLIAGCALAALGTTAAFASSHREAPKITETPKVDATDFYMFRSYEAGRQNYVTILADYIPLQNPGDGPNYYLMDANAYYDINIDNNADGLPDIVFRFRFINTYKDIKLNVGQKQVSIPLVQAGQVTATNPSTNLNVEQTYQVSMVFLNNQAGTAVGTPLSNGTNNNIFLSKPVDNIGNKTLPDYNAYANRLVYDVKLPGATGVCDAGKVFVGQRKDPFVVNLGQTFDLINIANPIGEQYRASGKDDLANKNVTTIALEVPIACLRALDDVVGAWTTASMVTSVASNGAPSLRQASRLGNPLVNELVIGLKDKDTFNASVPVNDTQFADYVTNPTLPALIELLYPSAKAPTLFPRNDLVATFLTGITSLNKPTVYQGVPAEEMRLNLSTPITNLGSQNRLGVIAGDNAGYPNGRRPGDDVVDISLRVAMGKLYTMNIGGGTSADAPAGALEFTDGAYVDATKFDANFPYFKAPLPGSP
jgi:hypothetical protein